MLLADIYSFRAIAEMGTFVEITNGLATQWIGAMWPIIAS